ncbi:sulfotransferase domain-containing protein [Neptuniibacter sp. PT8_73]|uniref:sulfotransferase domain-containing protein n=1 Tax=unclassified Neptuniibacter TaxID=2630693 RepID=UPI0039F6F7F0
MKTDYFYQLERFLRSYSEAPSKCNSSSVLLASFPKSGNSWFRFLVSNVNSIISSGEDVDFHSIERYSPVIRGNRNLKDMVLVDGAPTFLKTHFPHTCFFEKYKGVVIVRNPFFVIPSYYDYLINARGKDFKGDIEDFFYHWRYGFNAWGNFMESWGDRADVLLRYEDLQNDPLSNVSAMYRELGYCIDEDVIRLAVSKSSRSNMLQSLNKSGDPHNNNNFRFVKKKGENIGVELLKDSICNDSKINNSFLQQAEKYGYL